MVQLQLYIEGKQVELHDNESVTLTQTLQDVLDIQKIYTDYTRTFNVPASKTNNAIFKHFHNPAIVGNNTRGKRLAELQLNYKPFRTGRIKLESVQVKNGTPVNYRLTFFGNTIQLKDILGESMLNDLTVFNVGITHSASNVKTLMQDGVDKIIDDEDVVDAIIYPLISSSGRLYYDSGEDTAGTYNLHYGTNAHGVPYDELKPAVRVHAILLAIKKQFGINFSTDFFNKDNPDYYNLYLWLHKQKGKLQPENENAQFVLGGKWTIGDAGNPNLKRLFIQGGNYARYINADNTTGKRILTVSIDAPAGVDYTFRVRSSQGNLFEGEFTGSSTPIPIGDELFLPKSVFVSGLSMPLSYNFEILSTANATFTINAGVYDKTDFSGLTLDETVEYYATASAQVTTQTGVFQTSASTEMPKMKIIDFLTSLFKMFNLTAYFINDEIQVLPLDDWYAASAATYDITKYLDKTQSEVTVSYPYSAVKFAYQGLDTFFANSHNEFFNEEWGNLEYQSVSDYSKDTYSIELPFEHHKFERLQDETTLNYTTVQWGWSVNDNKETYLGKPLIFYAHKVESGTAISFQETLGGVKHSLTDYYIPSNSSDPTADTQTIHFGAELSEYTRNNQSKSLFDTYYRSYIEEVYDDSRRIFKYKAFLPLSIISNINLNDKVIIFNELYKINKMVTNFETGITDFELINEVRDYQVTGDEIVKDVVRTVDAAIATADNTKITVDATEILW